MIRNEYTQGQTAKFDITFRTSDDEELADIDTLNADVFFQGEILASYTYGGDPELTRLSEGVYRLTLDTTDYEAGIYRVQWHGGIQTVVFLQTDKFEVNPKQSEVVAP